MNKSYVWILLLLFSIILVACKSGTEKEPDNIKVNIVEKPESEENVEKTKTMSDGQIKNIIINNLDEMEDTVQANFDESLMPIDENTFAKDNSNEKAEEIVNETKNDFENLVANNFLDEWVRIYLYNAYISFHREYLNSDDIQTRFEVLEQSDEDFEVSFITLEDEGGIAYIAGTQHLFYISENDHWVIEKREFINTDEKPLNLTFEDLKDYYSHFNKESNFETIEEKDVDGVKHLVYKVDDEYYARNANNSMYNYAIIEEYNKKYY